MTSLPALAGLEIFFPPPSGKVAEEQVRLLLEDSLLDPGGGVPQTEVSRAWDQHGTRAQARRMHGWFFAQTWPYGLSSLDGAQLADLDSVLTRLTATWEAAAQADPETAFHDETTARRAIHVAALLSVLPEAGCTGSVPGLQRVLAADLHRLEDPSFYAGLTNHGMFQDIALLISSGTQTDPAAAERMLDTGYRRLTDYLHASYTQDGIHTEHSPTYHMLVSQHFRNVAQHAAQHGRHALRDEIEQVLQAADRYAAHAVTPAGTFPPVSDTWPARWGEQTASKVFPGGHLVGVVTHGQAGPLPPTRTFVSTASGYATWRSSFSSRDDSYVMLAAAYNGRYHKHSDELSVYWMDKGIEILREAGSYGYEYDDPYTQYAYSSYAHNTLLVDGRSLPRVDRKTGATTLTDDATTPDTLQVTGRTRRFKGVSWDRSLRVQQENPGATTLTLTDTIASSRQHTYTLLWHLGPDLTLELHEHGALLTHHSSGEPVATMRWDLDPSPTALRVVRGQETPTIQGWAFPRAGEKVPATCLEVDVRTRDARLTWSLSNHVTDSAVAALGPLRAPDPVAPPQPSDQRATHDGGASWRDFPALAGRPQPLRRRLLARARRLAQRVTRLRCRRGCP